MLYFSMTDLEQILTDINRQQAAHNSQLLEQNSSLFEELKALRSLCEKQSEQLEELLKSKRKKPRRKNGSLRDKPADKPENKGDDKKSKEKKPGGNKLRPPQNCPEEVIEIDVLEHEKFNPENGKPFTVIDVEERIRYVREVSWKKIIIRRNVYAGGKYGMIRADWPEQVLDTCSFEAATLAAMFVRRVLEHLPFNRQVEILHREGFAISRQSLCESFIRCTEQLGPLYDLLKQEILAERAIHIDETFAKEKRTPGCEKANGKLKQCYLWFICARAQEVAHQTLPPLQPVKDTVRPDQSLIYIEYADNRRQENTEIIGNYEHAVHSDCFSGYEKRADEQQYTWQTCNTHAARKFEEAPETPMNKKIVRMFKTFIKLDNKLWAVSREERQRRRQSEIKPLFDEIVDFLKAKQNLAAVQIDKKTSDAFAYFLKREKYFGNFLDNPDLMCDNNLAERGIRPIKLGLKNWLFFGSPRGGKAHSIAYSLLLTCRNIGVNPQEWLTHVLRNLPSTPKEELHTLLPHKWTPDTNTKSPFLPVNYSC